MRPPDRFRLAEVRPLRDTRRGGAAVTPLRFDAGACDRFVDRLGMRLARWLRLGAFEEIAGRVEAYDVGLRLVHPTESDRTQR